MGARAYLGTAAAAIAVVAAADAIAATAIAAAATSPRLLRRSRRSRPGDPLREFPEPRRTTPCPRHLNPRGRSYPCTRGTSPALVRTGSSWPVDERGGWRLADARVYTRQKKRNLHEDDSRRGDTRGDGTEPAAGTHLRPHGIRVVRHLLLLLLLLLPVEPGLGLRRRLLGSTGVRERSARDSEGAPRSVVW